MLVTVLIPVLDRPHRAGPVVDSLREAGAPSGVTVEPFFICSPGDDAEMDAIVQTQSSHVIVDWPPGPGDYARKINFGFGLCSLDDGYCFLGADDLFFHPGWLDAALRAQHYSGVCVIGTNDLGNGLTSTGTHSTHSLVDNRYADCGTIDDPTRILHEGYDHQWVDNEFIQTAKARGAFAHAADSHVEHLHPYWHKADMDPTYTKALAENDADRRLFDSRKPMWATL